MAKYHEGDRIGRKGRLLWVVQDIWEIHDAPFVQ